MEILNLREDASPPPLVVVHLGSSTLDDSALFPLLPTLDHPHWTVVLAAPTPEHFASIRGLFRGPVDNPPWTRQP